MSVSKGGQERPAAVVFGATGNQGSNVVKHLYGVGWADIFCVTRTPADARSQQVHCRGERDATFVVRALINSGCDGMPRGLTFSSGAKVVAGVSWDPTAAGRS